MCPAQPPPFMPRHRKRLVRMIAGVAFGAAVVVGTVYWNEARKEVVFLCGNFRAGIPDVGALSQYPSPRYSERETPLWRTRYGKNTLSTRCRPVMSETPISKEALKQALKEALVETLSEQQDLLRAIVAEVLEDLVLGEAMREGEVTEEVSRERIFDLLEGRA